MAQQGVDGVAQHVDQGLVAGAEEQLALGGDLGGRQPALLVARGQHAEEVVAGPTAPLLHQTQKVALEVDGRFVGRAMGERSSNAGAAKRSARAGRPRTT